MEEKVGNTVSVKNQEMLSERLEVGDQLVQHEDVGEQEGQGHDHEQDEVQVGAAAAEEKPDPGQDAAAP